MDAAFDRFWWPHLATTTATRFTAIRSYEIRVSCVTGAADPWRQGRAALSSTSPSRNLHIPHARGARPVANEMRQQRERRVDVRGLHAPPHGMTAGQAGRGGGPVAQRAAVAGPGGEGDVAFRRGVLMMKKEEGHAIRLLHRAPPVIRDAP